MATNSNTLLYIFNHLFLPSQLPQHDDYDAPCEESLLSTAIEGLIAWRDCAEPSRRGQAGAAISTIRNMQRAYSAVDGSLNKVGVLDLLTQFTEHADIPLYVREQNAGVLISRHSHGIFFEVFEISPNNEATMTTRGRLRRSFPGASVVLNESNFQQRQFQETIAHTLADMSRHPVEAMRPKVKKADSIIIEDRDTNHPGMVSEFLIGFLRSIGEAVECPVIAKNMRDDVLWDDSKLPWRRSPSWLVVRVILQLNFSRKPTPTTPDTLYREAILFILSYTLTLATQQSLSSEVLYSMSAKIARRLLKIGPAIDGGVLLYVQKAMKSAHAKLSGRWSIVQKQDAPAIDAMKLSNLDFISDCYVPILELDNHIKWMGVRRQERTLGSFQPPSTLMIFSPHVLPRLPQGFANKSESDAIANLTTFETWVALHCRQWTKDGQHNPYSRNPEALSAMLLTIFELWVACDDAAVNLCPLLSQYDHGIPRRVLQNLPLPFAPQMQRLHRVEQYLVNHTPECFPVKYYDDSTELQETHRGIIEDALMKKREKLNELHDLKMKYNNLMTLSNRLECEYEDILVDPLNRFYDSRHKASCAKCRYAKEAADIQISIYEWPLPRGDAKAKSIVFELLQLAAPSLDFRKDETTIFILQCLYQSGPSSDTLLRASHSIVDDERFAFSLLKNLTTAWHRVKENWESAQALGVFAAATARLLSLTSSDKVKQDSIKFLSTLHTEGFAWVELLRDKSYKAATQDDSIYFRLKSADVALICASCFDVKECHLSKILASDNDASIFVQCSILIQGGKRTYDPASELTLACLSLRFRRLLYRSLPILSKTHSGISDAVRKSWSAYRPGGKWRVACNTTHWLVTETAPGNEGVQFQVHYNLLSGEHLVNGIPLSHPPREYEDHPMWSVLFGRTAVEVMPTSAAAMQFSAKRQYEGYDVRFGRKETSSGGTDLLVQASCANIDYETIPSRLLQGMFPDHFINNFVHWYNHTNGTLEFRPLATPWDSRKSTWVLSRSPKGWTLKRKGSTSTVLGMKSRTVTAIANVLLSLADKPDIHMIFQPSGESLLEVEMPALQLGFFLTMGESNLRSREFRGMSIDGDQSLGTLTGFVNKMVLKDGNGRLVLMPEGPVSLGIYQWPHTCYGFLKHPSLNIDILAQIVRLCPTRQYYPQNEEVMQTVSWVPGLSFLSHHGGFYQAVSAIFKQALQTSLFYSGLDRKKLSIRSHIDTNKFFMHRDRIRTSTFQVSGFGAEEHTTAYDVTYRGRDCDQGSVRGTNAYVLSSMLYEGRTTLHTAAPQGGELWRSMLTVPKVLGPDQDLHLSQLKYSARAANYGLDLSRWPVLHKALSTESAMANKLSVMIWLSAVAAHEQADMRLLQVLALFTVRELRDVGFPSIQLCHPSKGYKATSELLKTTIHSNLVEVDYSPEARLEKNQERAGLLRSWPRETLPTIECVDQKVSDYVRLTKVESAVRQQFQEWFANLCLFEYLQRIERALSRLGQSCLTLYQPALLPSTPPVRTRTFVSARDLFAGTAPTLPMAPSALEIESSPIFYEEQTHRLVGLLDDLIKTGSRSRYEASYIKELHLSMQSLQGRENALYPNLRNRYPVSFLRQHLDSCKRNVDELYLCLKAESSAAHGGILEFGHGPRISQSLFLQQLSNRAWKLLSLGWRKCIARYGLTLSALQRAERLVRAANLQSDEELIKELRNIGHRTWEPLEHPEWLLLEVESNIIIRDVQEQIASEMIRPGSDCNAVLQLNMGEGKSSVIVPMVAAELADGSQLARVIVAKPQSKQMAQMLTSKLGGLLDRRVYHMPFSRALKASPAIARVIDQMMRECQDSGGVLLVQPEHLLSFQLMGIKCYLDESKQGIGGSFIGLHDFFNNNSRDIVDESDENFNPKFELVYTMGSQQPIELSPARWICLHQVLSLVRSLAPGVAEEFPQSIDIEPRDDGGFPRIRILKADDAGELLVERVARRICDIGLDGFPIARQQEHVREAVFNYITQRHPGPEEISAVEEPGDGGFWTGSTKPILLLLRGILAGGALAFALSQKRWRVNFGLATTRTPPTRLAVPYRAKDNPTPRSEFSHPDVVILLTSLSYYYGGLKDEDLFISLGHLMESDQANIEYDAWLKDSPLMPASFRQLEGINLKDRPQCISDVFPHLRYGKSVIDYFLGHVVFPKEVKEFPYKLSASRWDIGKRGVHYTTGFSGTKDSCKLLPLDIKHLDLPSQSHTNALVLEYLLQPENSVILLPSRPITSITNAEYFLDTVVKLEKQTRVILDVGAQILELNNQEVAQSWLQKVTDAETQAAVFINDDDELTVVDRRGTLELLQTSSYATRLDACLVFLDEAHTRGIDLKLPDDYRAAVTLGANLTKDRLVQACMRLRKLGKGQSVIFCVNGEISAKIHALTAKPTGATIGVKDVLHWAISETFADIGRNMPLWVVQGHRFLRQEELWRSAQADGITCMSTTKAERFLEDEAPSIEARYRPRLEEATEFEHLDFNLRALEEEQERELSPEVERERQVQRLDPAPPAYHFLHPDVAEFAATGRLAPNSPAYMPAFHALRNASAAKYFEASQLSNDKFLVTDDFARTVNNSDIGYTSDSFQRPVQWILSSCAQGSNVIDVLMLISPHEAEELIPWSQSERSDEVTLHLYKPRYHTGHQAFDRLDFFNTPPQRPQLEVPRALLVQLNLFAGQLYFGEYEDYLDTCKFLGLAADVPRKGEIVAAGGYIVRDGNGESKFDRSPVRFLQALTPMVRRNGQSISKTHVGSMLEGKLLERSDIKE
ncbi:hypothetical protein GGR58DRAFT_528215 [Xylaria digitata]|nr:hypothetical protein GGR58DRAFT_528215 [Xylaria digitata]